MTTIDKLSIAALVVMAAIFVVWVWRATNVKRKISDKPIQSTTLVGLYDHHGRYYEIEVHAGLVNIVDGPIPPKRSHERSGQNPAHLHLRPPAALMLLVAFIAGQGILLDKLL